MQEHSFIFSFKLISKALVFFTIVMIVLNYAGAEYFQAAKENTINEFTAKRYSEFYEQEKDSIDLVFLGSSHSYCTFDPEIIDEALGTNSWQLGTPSQHPNTTYYVLKEVLNHQSPKTVVMEVYWGLCDKEFEPKQADSFLEVLNNDDLKDEFLTKGFPIGEQVKYNIPAIRFQQDYFAYKSSEKEKELEEEYNVSKPWQAPANGIEYYRSKGYVYCDIIIDEIEFDKTNQFKGFDGKRWNFNNKQKEYLEKIVELCIENNIELIFVTAPVANVSMDFIENYSAVNEKVSDFAKKQDVPYVDYNIINMEEELFTNDNFRDDAHLNHSGVEILDKEFIKWVKENNLIIR